MAGRPTGRAELERLLAEETEASERTRDEPLSRRAARKRPTQSVVYSIRLTPEQTEEIQRIAGPRGYRRPGWCAAGCCRGWRPSGGVGGTDGGGAVAGRGPAEPPAHSAPGIVTGIPMLPVLALCPDGPGRYASRLLSVTNGPEPPWNGPWTGCP